MQDHPSLTAGQPLAGGEAGHYALADLFVLTTTIAVGLALLRPFGILGAVGCFLAMLVLTLGVYPRWRPDQAAIQRAAFDIGWGIIMPVVCFTAPIAGYPGDPRQPHAIDAPALLVVAASSSMTWFFAWQMLALALWSMVGVRRGSAAGFFLECSSPVPWRLRSLASH